MQLCATSWNLKKIVNGVQMQPTRVCQFYPVCNSKEFINFGLNDTVRSEKANHSIDFT